MAAVAARRLGCSYNTVRAYAERYPLTVGQAMHDERAVMGDMAELALFQAIQRGEMSAIIFYLKTQCKDRGYIERTEVKMDLEVYVRQRARELGLDEDEAMEAVKPQLRLVS